MKKLIIVLVVLVLVVVGAVVVFASGLAEKMAPSLWADKHRATVARRATELLTCVAQGDMDKCVDYMDPDFVREHGVRGVKLRFQLIQLIAVQAGKLTMDDVEVREVRLSPDNMRAEVEWSLRIKGEWKDQKPGTWVRKNGQWYALGDPPTTGSDA